MLKVIAPLPMYRRVRGAHGVHPGDRADELLLRLFVSEIGVKHVLGVPGLDLGPMQHLVRPVGLRLPPAARNTKYTRVSPVNQMNEALAPPEFLASSSPSLPQKNTQTHTHVSSNERFRVPKVESEAVVTVSRAET